MKRRDFITLLVGAAAWPLAARAQQPTTPVIGFLSGRSLSSDAHLVAAFRRGLSETGFVDGRNVAIEYRWAEGEFDRLPLMAAGLIDRRVAVLFVGGADVRMRPIVHAISATPIVFATAGDPVELNLVASLGHPGGNATGNTIMSAELWPKRLEQLRELTGGVTTIGLLINREDPSAERAAGDVQTAAASLGLKVPVLNATSERDFEPSFARLATEHAGALLVVNSALFNSHREELTALATHYAVPTMFDRREYAAAGGLISYGASNVDQYRQAGTYVGRILKGEKPADLPVLQPTKFDLVINLKTARALGLSVPDKLLALADEVIE
jgi:putative ABC transport system substrate-binding protein